MLKPLNTLNKKTIYQNDVLENNIVHESLNLFFGVATLITDPPCDKPANLKIQIFAKPHYSSA